MSEEQIKLTDRQLEMIGVIDQYWIDNGYGPSVRDIGAKMGIRSPNGVTCHLKALTRKGYIVMHDSTSRGNARTIRTVAMDTHIKGFQKPER